MTLQFDGKVALVTGAGAGIGRAAAVAFARAGARVAVSDVNVTGGEETVQLIRNAAEGSRTATFVRADVSRSGDVAALVAATVAAFGRLDCALNNAGVSGVAAPDAGGGPTHLHSEDLWQQVIAINLTGVWLCMKHEIAQMLQQGGGTIVNAASASSFRGTPMASAYAASKHGILGITRSAALEYAQAGIRVNAVAPGAIETPIWEPLFEAIPGFRDGVIARQPVGRMGTPEEVAAAVLWLCSDAASFVTGHALTVDGGYLAQ